MRCPKKTLSRTLPYTQTHTHTHSTNKHIRGERERDWPNGKWQNVTNVDLKSNNEKRFFIYDKDSLFNQIDFKWKQLDDDAILALLASALLCSALPWMKGKNMLYTSRKWVQKSKSELEHRIKSIVIYCIIYCIGYGRLNPFLQHWETNFNISLLCVHVCVFFLSSSFVRLEIFYFFAYIPPTGHINIFEYHVFNIDRSKSDNDKKKIFIWKKTNDENITNKHIDTYTLACVHIKTNRKQKKFPFAGKARKKKSNV